MFARAGVAIDEMGYAMSRLEIEEFYDDGRATDEASNSRDKSERQLNLDNEIAQLTKLRLRPHEQLSKAIPGKRDLPVNVVKMLAGRECNYSGRGKFSSADRCHMLSRYLPVNGPWLVDQMPSRAYVSQFSADGSLFFAGFQGSQIKIYNVDRGWKVQKNIYAKSLRWTITDTSLSPDQRHLVYASMSPIVHIVNVGSAATESVANITEIHDGLDFSAADDGGYSFGIFSVKFSTDGRELVAGSSDDSIYVYDLETNKLSLRILAHMSDVNTVCFADESGHLIYSGSDDNLCKIVVLLSDLDGECLYITFLHVQLVEGIFSAWVIDLLCEGHYPTSSNESADAVWDRRCLTARGKPAGVLMGHLEGITFLDSRGDGRYLISNGKDQAIKLWDIRKMSPNDSCTGQKYIYTGSHDSCVYIYDLVSGAQVAALKHHNSPVRDCSWHPNYPMLVSSSWEGDIIRWEFRGNGEAPIPMSRKRIRRIRHFY
ncbi:hypothetical protein JRO89_XS01G0255800 [Xanthoceras sorbifolium]|uniref:LEC14B homolog n=1 Tax=Xanthoceras sorbifolium TaxID=99658 RepID=A0ABQ8IL97_9ROSI|nr:hypothetical protein JRO89_XS01G0255800 [Xanthoceras sorbifolium]